MKVWTVDRNRRVRETCTVEAETESEALDIASEQDDGEWLEFKGYITEVLAYEK
jgi:hypothetical protein